ncbi:MAG TPA: c-type cytochrome, partial [Pelobium sp.]|nr:c-type cytochrome [Pelobium sp.]
MRKLLIPFILCGFTIIIFFNACNQETIKFQSYYSSGKTIYDTHCSNCHMDDGEGLA